MPRAKKQQSNDEPKTKTPFVKLTDYINKLYIRENQEPNWALIGSQIKNIKKKYNITETKIRYVLMYMVDIRQMNLFANLEQGSILNLVPYYIEETDEYLQFQKDVADSARKAKTKEHNIVVNVNRHKLKSHKYVSDNNLNFD